MNYESLRAAVIPRLMTFLLSSTHKRLAADCIELGLPEPPPEESGTKAERINGSINSLEAAELRNVANALLEKNILEPIYRNRIQDLIWESEGYPQITKRCRRAIARKLKDIDICRCRKEFDTLLEGLWVLNEHEFAPILGLHDSGLRRDIRLNYGGSGEGWTTERLFTELGAFDASDRRFALFLEGLASADVCLDEDVQRRFVECVNVELHKDNVELRETKSLGGYPVFRLVKTGGHVRGKPKNLIFASTEKPDLRFGDALDNDVEVLTHIDKVLVYDREIGAQGLLWSDLQRWWKGVKNISDDEEAKATLFRRLRECLPTSSPPQRQLFEAFYRGFGKAVPSLPALLPEIWLHWDPELARSRGKDALLRSRMDFLLLLPHGVRVVIEVDGKQHYSDENGRADSGLYGKMVSADRDLKLAGYEVFRFSGAELKNGSDDAVVETFFRKLFEKYGVIGVTAS